MMSTSTVKRVGFGDCGPVQLALAVGLASALPPPRVHPAWVMTKLERLDALMRQDPQRAKVEIPKHLDGDLVIVPRPSITGERRAEISGRARSDSLLRDQEAVCLQVVAGVGFEPTTLWSCLV
jgi:hypothetical protein